jgi:hypothetical protein
MRHLTKGLRDVLRFTNEKVLEKPFFGGVTVVLGGDFRQILPIIPQGKREHIINASIMGAFGSAFSSSAPREERYQTPFQNSSRAGARGNPALWSASAETERKTPASPAPPDARGLESLICPQGERRRRGRRVKHRRGPP